MPCIAATLQAISALMERRSGQLAASKTKTRGLEGDELIRMVIGARKIEYMTIYN